MIRRHLVFAVAIAMGVFMIADSVSAEPTEPKSGDSQKPAAKAGPATKSPSKSEKEDKAAAVPDITGVWKGRILGHGGGPGGGGPGGGGRGRGGRGRGPGGGGAGGGGGRQMDIELTIDAKTIKTRDSGRGGGSGTYSLTGNGTGNLDAEGTEGRYDGREYLGIYELKGDELKWSVSNGHIRPKGFTPQGGSYVMILKRQK